MKYFWILLAFQASLAATAATVVAVENQETVIPINSELGSILELPSAVKTVTPSKFFLLQDVASGAAATGAKADVRTFLVKPMANASGEVVTFVLANGRALSLNLLPAPSADKYYSISLAEKRRGQAGKFLGPEMAMMRAMLVDEAGGFAREMLSAHDKRAKVDVAFEGLEFTLRRLYGGADLTGYVFLVQNRSSGSVNLNLSSLALAKPNRAVIGQADKSQLVPCPMLSTSPDCETALRLVVKGPKPAAPLLTHLGPSEPPFAEPAVVGGKS